jgi:hypothetical protein
VALLVHLFINREYLTVLTTNQGTGALGLWITN